MPELASLTNIINSVELNASALLADANLQGYWRLEANGNDTGPNGYNLTAVNTPTFATGKFGNGADLEDASSQYFTLADGSCPNLEILGSKSWSVWVKPETNNNGSWHYIMSKFHNVNQAGCRMALNDTGLARFQCKGLTTNEAVVGVSVVPTGVWSHIVGVYSSAAGKLRIYVNGVKEGEVTASGSSTDSNTGFDIGSNSGDQHLEYFDGIIDDVAVFNKALTDAEIWSLYKEPLAYYKLENVNDSGAYGRTLTNTGSVAFNAGKFTNAADFGASNTTKYLRNATNLGLTGDNPVTYSFWANVTTAPTAGNYIALFSHYTTAKVDRYWRPYYRNNAGTLELVNEDSGTNTIVAQTLTVGVWYHLVFIRNGATANIYVNGVLIATGSTGSFVGGSNDSFIGSYDGNLANGLFSGLIDDLAVFPRPLSAAEVLSIYASATARRLALMGVGN